MRVARTRFIILLQHDILSVVSFFYVIMLSRNLLQHDAGHLKVADFGLGKLLDPLAADSNALYEMTGETGSCKLIFPISNGVTSEFLDYFLLLDVTYPSMALFC